jgi:hypothetical protein
MQKLESEPAIEFHNFARAYDGLREAGFNDAHFDAWRLGMTGYLMVDACMRSLVATGWLNFRMRAMLVSFASYHRCPPCRLGLAQLAQGAKYLLRRDGLRENMGLKGRHGIVDGIHHRRRRASGAGFTSALGT